MRFNDARSRWLVGAAVVALVAVAVAGVVMFLSSRGEFDSVDELVQGLEEAGLECENLEVSPPDQAERVGGEFGFCYLDGETVNIHVYDDEERVDTHVELNVRARTDSAENDNIFSHGVRGSNWVVDAYSRSTAERVQEALGGSLF